MADNKHNRYRIRAYFVTKDGSLKANATVDIMAEDCWTAEEKAVDFCRQKHPKTFGEMISSGTKVLGIVGYRPDA